MTQIKIIIGIFITTLSLILTYFSIFNILFSIIGIFFIIYNKDEKTIEKRKDIKTKKSK